MTALRTPETVAARLAAQTKPRPTYLIVVDGTVGETEVGFAWSDMLDSIWSGDGPKPKTAKGWVVQEAVFEQCKITNVTDIVAEHLCQRTRDLRETPAHLRAWLEWCGLEPFDDDEADDATWAPRGGRARHRQAAG